MSSVPSRPLAEVDPAGLRLPDRAALRRHVSQSLDRYWPRNAERVEALGVGIECVPEIRLPLRLEKIDLPSWSGPDDRRHILVPAECIPAGSIPSYDQVDWWLAAFLLLECWHERRFEKRMGPLHSYSYHLVDWDSRAWDRAWVNRIALFFREWAAHVAGVRSDDLFGPLPTARIGLTFDVDAIEKTSWIRLKRGAFDAFNVARIAVRGELVRAVSKAAESLRFIVKGGDWWQLDHAVDLAEAIGVTGSFNVYSRPSLGHSRLFDPAYTLTPPLLDFIRRAGERGWEVGVHPGFESWRDAAAIGDQRARLEHACGKPVRTCRQHWLRFSFEETWTAQTRAGLHTDETLMFNDRPGFRAACALCWNPWDAAAGRRHAIEEIPTLFMDSHFYDYGMLTPEASSSSMRAWLREVQSVGGEIRVLWHPHTLADDYGWAPGFHALLTELSALDAEC